MNSKEEKQLVHSRWTDVSSIEVIHEATEEERRAGIKEMIDTITENMKSKDKGEDKKKKIVDNKGEDECEEG